jgi:hypothetical protein
MSTFNNGGRVQLHGLVGAKQHNGKSGFVVGFDEETGRYAVVMEGDMDNILKVKPQNMKLMATKEGDGEAYAEIIAEAVEIGHGSATTEDPTSARLIALLQEQMRQEREARERAEERMASHIHEREKTARTESRNSALRDTCCCCLAASAVVGTAAAAGMAANSRPPPSLMDRY